MRSIVGALCLSLLSIASFPATPVIGQSAPPSLSVDISSGRHPISRDVYGIVSYGLDPTFAQEIAVPNIRWGGDGTTRYNWQVDSSNAGFDWFFMGGDGDANPVPSAAVDQMIRTYHPADALITVPIIPYVNKSAAWTCSFPVSIYGAQQATNPYVHPNGDNCGNSIAASGTQLSDTNIYSNHIDNTPALQQGWIQHLTGTFGTAAQGGVNYYQLDNEPYGWSNTHRDVEPNGADYATITQLGQQYAATIKQVDPAANVLGPSDFTLGGWIGDPSKQNGLFAAQYYLQQMALYQQQHGTRILDYLDEHYYFDVSSPSAQLASTRTLWDPTFNGGTWVEQYFFYGPMQLIPRFKGWVNQYYPGTKLALSEYSIDSGKKSIVDALAEMDVLGIFGREQLDFANMWSPPAPTDPIAYAYRLYRNYDGAGARYGDTWVNAASSDQSQLSIYSAQRSTDNVVTIIVINKTPSAIATSVALSGGSLPATAAVYSYSGANLQKIVAEPDTPIRDGELAYSFPGYSATLFAFAPTVSTSPAATTTALSANPTQATTGSTVDFVATVSGGKSPSGTVTFLDGTASLGSMTLSSGTASLNTAALSVGSHTITAGYGGDAGNAGSISSAVSVTINEPAPPTSPPAPPAPPAPPPTPPAPPASLIPTSTTLQISSSALTTQQSLTVMVTVTATDQPTGTVTLLDGNVALGSMSLANGVASFTETNLAAGSHSLVATYIGDASNAMSVSMAGTVVVTQPPPPSASLHSSTTSLTLSAAQIPRGQNMTLTATVAGDQGLPTGTVSFAADGQTIGTSQLSGGVAAYSTSSLTPGGHTLLAAYGGNGSYTASNSAGVSVVVTIAPPPSAPAAPDFSLQLGQSALTLAAGASGQVGVVLAPQNGFDEQLMLRCTGLPQGATCSFSPPAVTPAAPMTLNLTVATAAAPPGLLLSFPAVALLLIRRRRRIMQVAAACLLLLIAGCGYTVNSHGPVTPAGSYAVQITATAANGQSHSQNLALTVQ